MPEVISVNFLYTF